MRSCRQPIKGNMELPCRVPWERGYLNSRERSSREPTENVWVKRSSKIHQGKQFVRSDPFCYIKLSCLRFLWLGPSVRFATKWHLFLTISWRLLFFNVLGNVTSSLLLYVSLCDVNETCKSRSTTQFIPTPKVYHVTMKPSKIIRTSDVYNQDK